MMGKQIKKSDLNVPTARGRKRGLLFIALAVALFFGAKAVHWYTNLGLLIDNTHEYPCVLLRIVWSLRAYLPR